MPTRYLKPGICDSEAIDKCSPIAETLFYRLLVNVDDYGRLDARPAVVRGRLTALHVSGLLPYRQGSSSSERLLQLCNAEKGLSKLSIVVPEIHNKDVA